MCRVNRVCAIKALPKPLQILSQRVPDTPGRLWPSRLRVLPPARRKGGEIYGDSALEVSKKAIFLDRDGVINAKLPEDRYVKRPAELALMPDVADALRRLRGLGYLLVIVTNQRGIGRGFMTAEDLEAVHDHLKRELSRGDAQIDAVYYCPHDIWESCMCRKPEPGLILTAASDWDIDLKASYLVGDSPSDMEAGHRAGTRTVRITPGNDDEADLAFASLTDFARYLEINEQGCRN